MSSTMAGVPTQRVDWRHGATHLAFDPAGNLTALTDSWMNTTSFEVDRLDRTIADVNQLGRRRAFVTSRYVHDGADIVLAFNSSRSITNRYLHGPAIDQVFADEQVGGSLLWSPTEPRANGRPLCSGGRRVRPGYDRLPPRKFEFVPLWQISVYFVYSMRRVACATCGVTVEEIPGLSAAPKSLRVFECRFGEDARRENFDGGDRQSPPLPMSGGRRRPGLSTWETSRKHLQSQ
jgi:YD repeat-containing protein